MSSIWSATTCNKNSSQRHIYLRKQRAEAVGSSGSDLLLLLERLAPDDPEVLAATINIVIV